MVNVGKYTIHGSYGFDNALNLRLLLYIGQIKLGSHNSGDINDFQHEISLGNTGSNHIMVFMGIPVMTARWARTT